MNNNKQILSPKIKRLSVDIKVNKDMALKNFWNEISKNGAPIIEKIENSDKYLLTLVWREQEHIDNISVFGEIFGMNTIKENRFAKLEDTDLWYRTWKDLGQ